MPIGELQDLIDLSLARDGAVKISKARRNVSHKNGRDYIPTDLR